MIRRKKSRSRQPETFSETLSSVLTYKKIMDDATTSTPLPDGSPSVRFTSHGYDIYLRIVKSTNKGSIKINPSEKPGQPKPVYRDEANPHKEIATVFLDFFVALQKQKMVGESLEWVYTVGCYTSSDIPFLFLGLENTVVVSIGIDRQHSELDPFLTEEEFKNLMLEDTTLAVNVLKTLEDHNIPFADEVRIELKLYNQPEKDLWAHIPYKSAR
ncbi:MAG: hypothetical protein GY797_22615 [Deltaproteobacteria bacterium]|nr:hypothetical protein [Deltaproteobacteria bacterium]